MVCACDAVINDNNSHHLLVYISHHKTKPVLFQDHSVLSYFEILLLQLKNNNKNFEN